MKAISHLRIHQWSDGLLAAGIACLLFIQALIMSVGLGMGGSASHLSETFVICSASSLNGGVSTAKDEPRRPSQHPHCPFCFVAEQSDGQIATAVDTPRFLAHVTFNSADAIYARLIDRILVLPLRRRVSDPRAPPKLFV
ncbi:MAG: DUF2946 family protein [Methylovirgula sp.]